MSELTEAEREKWDVDPDEWPHTPPLHVFRALMDEDDNTWWRAGSGHGLNAYEAAVERVEELERAAAREADAHAAGVAKGRAAAMRWTDLQPGIRRRLHEMRGHDHGPYRCAACDQDADQLARAALAGTSPHSEAPCACQSAEVRELVGPCTPHDYRDDATAIGDSTGWGGPVGGGRDE